MPNRTPSDLGQALQDVTEKVQLLVHEEIELAKAELTDKVTKLIKGAVVGLVAGIFAVAALIYLLHSFSWGLWAVFSDNLNFVWVGYLLVGALLLLLGALGGFMAARYLKKGSPPTPAMAIEEGKLIKETLTSSRPATPTGPAGTVAADRSRAEGGR